MTRESPRSPVSSVRLVSSLFLAVYRYHLVMSAHLSRARLLEKVVCEQVVCEELRGDGGRQIVLKRCV